MLWRKGLRGLSFDSQSSENGFVKREGKSGLLMHVSLPTALFSLSVFLLIFFSIFYLSVFSFPSILSFLPLAFFFFFTVHGYPLFYYQPLWDLPLLSLNYFWLLVGISPVLPTNLAAVQPLPLPKECWLHHSPFPDKITCLVSYLSLFLFYPYR